MPPKPVELPRPAPVWDRDHDEPSKPVGWQEGDGPKTWLVPLDPDPDPKEAA